MRIHTAPALSECGGVYIIPNMTDTTTKRAPLILSILASPRQHGNTALLLDAAERNARAAGAEVIRLNIAQLDVKPCAGCMKCRTSGHCSLPKDDGHRAAELLKQADSVLIAAPVYWSSIPGTLKVLIDRLVSTIIDTSRPDTLPKPLMRGTRIGIITACTAPWPFSITQTRPAVKTLRRIFRSGGATVYTALCMTGTRHIDAPKPSAMKSAASLGTLLVHTKS